MKKHLDAKGVLIEFREGKIYWCAYGVNIGIDIDEKNKLIVFVLSWYCGSFPKSVFEGSATSDKVKKMV